MLVKLLITILFSLVYLTSTSGIVLNAHYCEKKLVHITFTKNDDGNCCGKKKMSKKCCKDKSAFFKLKDNHKIDNSIKISKSPLKVIQNCAFVNLNVLNGNPSTIINYNFYSPPVLYQNPIYLINKVFLI